MRSVNLREFSLALRSPLGTSKGTIRERRGFLLGVAFECDDGGVVRGVGEASPLPPWTESYDACRASMRRLTGELRRGTLDSALDELGPAAHHAATLASSDGRARKAGVPLSEWLAEQNGTDRAASTVPVNATVGDGSVDETVSAAEAAVADGFGCLKVKVGARPLDADVDRVRAVRDAVGDDVTLRADANGAWNAEGARRAVDVLAALDFAYVEQPLAADNVDGHAALRGRGVGIALDESVNGSGEWPHPIGDYADAVVLKPMTQGGPGPTVALARRVQADGVTPVVTTTIDAVVARTAAVHAAAAIPNVPACGLATGDFLDEDLTSDPCPVDGGQVAVPPGPGLAGDSFDPILRER